MVPLIQEINRLEKEIEERKDQLIALRRKLPPTRVENYQLTDAYGLPITLLELFGDQKDMIMIHNMGHECPYCTLWADGLNGLVPYLRTRATVVLVSPDEPATMRAFAENHGWQYEMVSSVGSTVTKDLGFESDQGYVPGFSTLALNADGTIDRLAYAEFGPGDDFCGLWFMLPLLKDGLNGWSPRKRPSP